MAYTVTFWGTRGSIPTPGAHTARYGGNTPCVAVEGPGGQLVILDAGTGIRALGLQLVERQNGAVNAEILLSHAHWDHIQGLPHFKPFFSPGNAVRIWGSRQGTTSLEAILRQQMDPAVFPIPLDALSAKLTVQQVDPGEFTVGAFRVRAMRLRHRGAPRGQGARYPGGGAGGAGRDDPDSLIRGARYAFAFDRSALHSDPAVACRGGAGRSGTRPGHPSRDCRISVRERRLLRARQGQLRRPAEGDRGPDDLRPGRQCRSPGSRAGGIAKADRRAKPERRRAGGSPDRGEDRQAGRRTLRRHGRLHRLLRRLPARRTPHQRRDERDRQSRVGPDAA